MMCFFREIEKYDDQNSPYSAQARDQGQYCLDQDMGATHDALLRWHRRRAGLRSVILNGVGWDIFATDCTQVSPFQH